MRKTIQLLLCILVKSHMASEYRLPDGARVVCEPVDMKDAVRLSVICKDSGFSVEISLESLLYCGTEESMLEFLELRIDGVLERFGDY